MEVSLAPGKEIELYEWKLELRPASEALLPRGPYTTKQSDRFSTLYGTGKFHVQYERVLGNSSSGTMKLDPTLSKLATGKLELEIKSEPQPKSGKPGSPNSIPLPPTGDNKPGGRPPTGDDKPGGERVPPTVPGAPNSIPPPPTGDNKPAGRLPEERRKKAAAKHDFTNLQRLATALENYNYPENSATRITVWCQGGGKGTRSR